MHKNMDLHTTMLIYKTNDQVLLGFKNRGFGAGTYNGFGGKVQEGEDILSALIRECQEEANITPINPRFVGVINYNEPMQGSRKNIQMHIFTCTQISGNIAPSPEMIPEFFDINALPLDKMLPDTAIWLPLILDGYNITADFILNDDLSIKSYTLHKNLL